MRSSFLYRFLIVFLPAAMLAGISAWMIFRAEVEHARHHVGYAGQMAVQISQGAAERALDQIKRDVLYLARSQGLKRAIRAEDAQAAATLGADWREFARARQVYDRIRWIDETGQERVRVDLGDGDPHATPAYALQAKEQRYYFIDTLKLGADEIYIAPFELNVEGDKIETPHKPILRIGTPVFDDVGKKRGIVLVNYLGRDLLELVRSTHDSPLWLVNAQGFWLLGPQPEDAWGFMLQRPEATVARRHPQAWQQIIAQESGEFVDQDGFWAYRTLRPGKQIEWKLIHLLPQAEYASQVKLIGLRFGLVTALVILILMAGAWRVAATKRDKRDALSLLSHSKQDLDRRLAEMTQKLAQANDALAVDEARMRELNEECQAIMQASPDAFWLLDSTGTIIEANPAYCTLMGYAREEVVGHTVGVFEVRDSPQQIAIHLQRIRRMGGDRFDACHRARNGKRVDFDVRVAHIPTLDQFAAFLHVISSDSPPTTAR